VAKEKGASLGPVLFTVLLDLLGFGLVIPLLSFYAESFGATATQATLIMAVYSLAQFLMAPVWGTLSDRVGRRPVMLISLVVSVIGLVGFASAGSITALFLWRTLHGAGAANISTAQAYVADVTDGPDRARGMGFIGAAFGIGFTIGPMVGGLLSVYGLAAPIWLAAGLSLINLIWAFFGLPESRKRSDASNASRTISLAPIASVLRRRTVGALVGLTFVVTFAFALMETSFALVAEHDFGLDPLGVGKMFFLIGMIGVVVQGGLTRRLVARLGESKLVVIGFGVNVLGLAILATATGMGGLYAGSICLGLGSSLANPSLSSLISRSANADEQGEVLGVNQSLSALARAGAPSLSGPMFDGIGHRSPFTGAAILLLVGIGALGRRVMNAGAELKDA